MSKSIETQSALKSLMASRGYEKVSPPILQKARHFLDFSGEDIRRRLYLTTGADGAEYCLRPDFTIPVSLIYLAEKAGTPAALSYLGPVFRQRADGPAEFSQAGVEMFAHEEAEASEAEILGFASEAVALYGLKKPEIRLGDSAVLSSVLSALDVAEGVARRIRRAMGRGEKALLEALEPRDPSQGYDGLVSALGNKKPEEARALVRDILQLAGIAEIGGRPVEHIGERFVEKAALSGGLEPRAREVLEAYFAISGRLPEAISALEALSARYGLDLNGRIESFKRRAELLEKGGLDLSSIAFSARFGRRMDYYTGVVFELYDPKNLDKGHVVGGGRYDGLLKALGAKTRVPAVGCSIWLERLEGGK